MSFWWRKRHKGQRSTVHRHSSSTVDASPQQGSTLLSAHSFTFKCWSAHQLRVCEYCTHCNSVPTLRLASCLQCYVDFYKCRINIYNVYIYIDQCTFRVHHLQCETFYLLLQRALVGHCCYCDVDVVWYRCSRFLIYMRNCEFSLVSDNHICNNGSCSALHHNYCKQEVCVHAEPVWTPIPVLQ